jgi:hypothetical protein
MVEGYTMREVLIVLIFCMVLFTYLHVHYHLKTSDDLEVYEIEQPSKEKLEEICDLRQPVVFDYPNERLLEVCRRENMRDTYGAFDVKVRNIATHIDDEEEMYLNFPLTSALTATIEDKQSKYLIENNHDFLDETGVVKAYKYNDEFIRPYMVSSCHYDYTTASSGLCTPFRYDINYRNYYLVTEGNVRVKLAPPRSSKYLIPHNDYENFEFRSPVNPWNVQQQYKPDFDKIKCLEVSLAQGKMISVPAYWWYSFEYGDSASIASFKYRTYMNTVAVLPKLVMRVLQAQNVKRKVAQEVTPLFDKNKNEEKEEN